MIRFIKKGAHRDIHNTRPTIHLFVPGVDGVPSRPEYARLFFNFLPLGSRSGTTPQFFMRRLDMDLSIDSQPRGRP